MVVTGSLVGGTLVGLGTGKVTRSPHAWWTAALLAAVVGAAGLWWVGDLFFVLWQAALGAHTGAFVAWAHSRREEDVEPSVEAS
jgi:hypothetical protein